MTTRDALTLAHGDLTEHIIGAFYEVYNSLGIGFVESVYTRALALALRDRRVTAERECPLTVRFRNVTVGEFRADLLVERLIIVEIKTADKIVEAHERQVRNYLRAARLTVGLILNVSTQPTVRRLIWTPTGE